MSDKALQDWLKRKSGDSSPTKLSAEEKAELARFDRLWEAAAPAANDLTVDTDAAWAKVDDRLFGDEKVVSINRGRTSWLSIAATLIVLVVAAFLVRGYLAEDTGSLQFATNAEASEFSLPDGTRIYLNKNSQLTYNQDDNTRMVKLEGEAFFDVARNEDQPFSITTGELVTTVLGTSFNIRAYANEPGEVVVKTGKVAVALADQEVILTPDEKVTYEPQARKLSQKKEALVDAEAWRTRALNFKSAPLGEVITILENVYGREIDLRNPALTNCPFNSSFKDAELSDILADISFVLGAEIIEDGGTVSINGGDCE
ncbi:hypothetical protein CEQ90_12425 [Lewinellaceae bacterium SD302]|nr:hypothetical protein CEQ90_12425 [Lewinellaceae bacterium SD302]